MNINDVKNAVQQLVDELKSEGALDEDLIQALNDAQVELGSFMEWDFMR
jgi:hypothetical protein